MATGLTFGTISSLFGLEHDLITREQYASLVTVVILTAIIPTVIAERWFDPGGRPREESWGQPSTALPATEVVPSIPTSQVGP